MVKIFYFHNIAVIPELFVQKLFGFRITGHEKKTTWVVLKTSENLVDSRKRRIHFSEVNVIKIVALIYGKVHLGKLLLVLKKLLVIQLNLRWVIEHSFEVLAQDAILLQQQMCQKLSRSLTLNRNILVVG